MKKAFITAILLTVSQMAFADLWCASCHDRAPSECISNGTIPYQLVQVDLVSSDNPVNIQIDIDDNYGNGKFSRVTQARLVETSSQMVGGILTGRYRSDQESIQIYKVENAVYMKVKGVQKITFKCEIL